MNHAAADRPSGRGRRPADDRDLGVISPVRRRDPHRGRDPRRRLRAARPAPRPGAGRRVRRPRPGRAADRARGPGRRPEARVRRRLRGRRADHVPGPPVRDDRRADHRVRPRLPRGARPAGRRVRRGPHLRDVGRDAHRRVGRPAGDVPRPRADGAAGLRDGRLPQVRRLLDRGRDQVLPARLVLERDPPVRARVRVGPDRHDAHPGRVRPAPADRERQRAAGAGAGPRARVPDHRRSVQDRRRPVPLLDARRLPGLADAGHRLPVGRPQDRRLRADHPAVRRRARAARGRLEHRDHGPRGA